MNDTPKPGRNWDKTFSRRETLVIGAIFLSILLLIVFLSTCTTTIIPGPTEAGPYSTFEERVEKSFETGEGY